MKRTITIQPNTILTESQALIQQDGMESYTGAYIGKYTYCCGANIDNGAEFTIKNDQLIYNFQIGNFNSIGANLSVIFARNHSTRKLDTGALQLMLSDKKKSPVSKSTYTQKGTIILQNDIWFGENVTVMPGVIIRNGAVIARNSHVVKDVPPYAIVGGNLAKIIGYRFNEKQIKMLQEIQWWFWDDEKILENAQYFTEDIDAFCEKFYPNAHEKFLAMTAKRKNVKDIYFTFLDYYEGYCNYPLIIEEFVNNYYNDGKKKLILFVQDDCDAPVIQDNVFSCINSMISELNEDNNILCQLELIRGNDNEAQEIFLNCSHYITSRTFRTVYYTCLADMYNIDIIHGVDSPIKF